MAAKKKEKTFNDFSSEQLRIELLVRLETQRNILICGIDEAIQQLEDLQLEDF